MRRLTAPYWWHDPTEPDHHRTRGGTICLVHTGERLLGISAAHVHRRAIELRSQYPGTWCQIGGHTFEPEASIIDISDELDLVTYSLSEVQTNAAIADVHHAPRWPPLLNQADAHILAGWPWSLSRDAAKETDFQFLHFIGTLDTCDARTLGAVTYTSQSVAWGRNALPPGTNIGGMSGGPVYRLDESGLTTLTLVGIVYEYQPSFEIVLARPLSLIDSNGRIVG